jgi:RNA polymerase sigma-70 factor (ECF subfamily)
MLTLVSRDPASPAPDTEVPLRRLYDEHGPVLLAYLVRQTRGDLHRAEDILQETALRAWRHPQARNDNGDWNRRWLFTVANRILIDNVRAARSRPAPLAGHYLDEAAAPVDEYERLIQHHELRSAIAELPPQQRDVIREIYLHDQNIEPFSS